MSESKELQRVIARAVAVRTGLPDTNRNASREQPDMGIGRDLIKAMAMDAGKSLCAYLEVMFPQVWHGQNSGFKISMKHHVYNDIMALADLHDESAIRKRLADNEAHRKAWVGAYRKMRRKKCVHGFKKYECGLCDDERRAKAMIHATSTTAD